MAKWTRRKMTIDGRVIGDDWLVKRDGWVVGRVRLQSIPDRGLKWLWQTITDERASGQVDTIDHALEKVRANATETWPVERFR